MPYTKDASVVTTFDLDLVEANATTLGLKYVARGEQGLIPNYPAVTLRSGRKSRSYRGTHKYDLEFNVILMVYFGKIGEIEMSELEVEELSDSIENLLHSKKTMDGLVYDSYVAAIDPGMRVTSTANIRTTRITHKARSIETF